MYCATGIGPAAAMQRADFGFRAAVIAVMRLRPRLRRSAQRHAR